MARRVAPARAPARRHAARPGAARRVAAQQVAVGRVAARQLPLLRGTEVDEMHQTKKNARMARMNGHVARWI